MNLIIGLGNPGKEYKLNRHNVGFMAIDRLAYDYNMGAELSKFDSIIYYGEIENQKTALIKPMTYMNNSGIAISKISKYYKINIDKIIVIHDELDIPTAKIKMKIGGGSGGHNGIKSIDNHIGNNYKRIRIGIDHPGDKNMVSDYVLSNFKKDEMVIIEDTINYISNNIALILNNFLNQIKKG